METPITIKKCIHCGNNHSNRDTNFCNQFCFELWYQEQSVRTLTILFDKILDANLSVGPKENANDGKC